MTALITINDLICPITHDRMEDPVICVDGNTYERSAIEKWFKNHNIEFISSIPSSDYDYDYQNIFEKKSLGNFFSRILNQFLMIFNSLGSDGGLFVLIGKKNNIDNLR